jgi:hypothetical protein
MYKIISYFSTGYWSRLSSTLVCVDRNYLSLVKVLGQLSTGQLAWIAGFLDGDGHIGCRIIPRSDYRFGFKITPEISFTQKSLRGKLLLPYLKVLLGNIGSVRHKSSGVSVLEVQGRLDVYAVLNALSPHLVLKNKQAKYCMDVIAKYDQALVDPKLFVELCRKSDRISALNDSRKDQRTNTSAVVIAHLIAKRLI